MRLSLFPKLATNRQQLEFDILLRSTLSLIQSTLLQIQSTLSPVCTGQSNTVDFVNCQHVEFNSVASVYQALETHTATIPSSWTDRCHDIVVCYTVVMKL